MDLKAALNIVDQAIDAIDEFDVVYRKASDNEGPAFRQFWDQSLEIEQRAVLPRLEFARQLAAHAGADDLPIADSPDKSMYKSHPQADGRRR